MGGVVVKGVLALGGIAAAILAIVGLVQVVSGWLESDPAFTATHVVGINLPGQFVHEVRAVEVVEPIDYALFLDVVSQSDVRTRIRAYRLEVRVDGQWYEFPRLSVLDPASVYWLKNRGDLTQCMLIDLSLHGFDIVAARTSLDRGDSIRGWMFFSWTDDLAHFAGIPFEEMRLTLWNNQGAEETVSIDYFDVEREAEIGGADMVVPDGKQVDLSNRSVRRHYGRIPGRRSLRDE